MLLELVVEIRLILARLASTTLAVKLAGDGVCHGRKLLLLLLKVLGGGSRAVLVEPLSGLLDSVENLDSTR